MNPRLRLGGVLILGLFLNITVPGNGARAEDRMRAPREERQARARDGAPASGAVMVTAMRFFRTTISPVDGDRCPSYPTCSHYGEQAVRKHGPFLGLLLFVDRQFHEWSETAISPKITVYGVKRTWDPLEANDFWFADSGSRDPRSGPHGGTP
jgi:uncharacterized protein